MPQKAQSIPLPAELLDAVDATVGPDERSRFVTRAVAATLLHRRLAQADGDPGIEPWWPLDDLDFVVLRSGEVWLEGDGEGDGMVRHTGGGGQHTGEE